MSAILGDGPPAVTQAAFGIGFSSSTSFAELTPAAADAAPEVVIEWGEVPDALSAPTLRHNLWQTAPSEYLLRVPDIAGFHVTASRIVVQPEPDADETMVRLYLFGSVMGALLHLRGVLPLHGSAVEMPDGQGAAVFVGASGAGKSTLAAALARRGYRLMSDDISAIEVAAEGSVLRPGLGRSKLRRAAADFLRFDPGDGRPVGADKFAFALPVAPEPATIARVYQLTVREDVDIALTPVVGAQKVRLLERQTFRRNYVPGFGTQGAHMQRLVRLAGQVRAASIVRPPSEQLSVDDVITLIERDWAS